MSNPHQQQHNLASKPLGQVGGGIVRPIIAAPQQRQFTSNPTVPQSQQQQQPQHSIPPSAITSTSSSTGTIFPTSVTSSGTTNTSSSSFLQHGRLPGTIPMMTPSPGQGTNVLLQPPPQHSMFPTFNSTPTLQLGGFNNTNGLNGTTTTTTTTTTTGIMQPQSHLLARNVGAGVGNGVGSTPKGVATSTPGSSTSFLGPNSPQRSFTNGSNLFTSQIGTTPRDMYSTMVGQGINGPTVVNTQNKLGSFFPNGNGNGNANQHSQTTTSLTQTSLQTLPPLQPLGTMQQGQNSSQLGQGQLLPRPQVLLGGGQLNNHLSTGQLVAQPLSSRNPSPPNQHNSSSIQQQGTGAHLQHVMQHQGQQHGQHPQHPQQQQRGIINNNNNNNTTNNNNASHTNNNTNNNNNTNGPTSNMFNSGGLMAPPAALFQSPPSQQLPLHPQLGMKQQQLNGNMMMDFTSPPNLTTTQQQHSQQQFLHLNQHPLGIAQTTSPATPAPLIVDLGGSLAPQQPVQKLAKLKKASAPKPKVTTKSQQQSHNYPYSMLLTTDLYRQLQFSGMDYNLGPPEKNIRIRVQPIIHTCKSKHVELQEAWDSHPLTPIEQRTTNQRLIQPYHHYSFFQSLQRHDDWKHIIAQVHERRIYMQYVNMEREKWLNQQQITDPDNYQQLRKDMIAGLQLMMDGSDDSEISTGAPLLASDGVECVLRPPQDDVDYETTHVTSNLRLKLAQMGYNVDKKKLDTDLKIKAQREADGIMNGNCNAASPATASNTNNDNNDNDNDDEKDDENKDDDEEEDDDSIIKKLTDTSLTSPPLTASNDSKSLPKECVVVNTHVIPFDRKSQRLTLRIPHGLMQQALSADVAGLLAVTQRYPPYLTQMQQIPAPLPLSATVNLVTNAAPGGTGPTISLVPNMNQNLLVQPLQLPQTTPTREHFEYCSSPNCPLRDANGSIISLAEYTRNSPHYELFPLLHNASLAPLSNPLVCLHELHNIVQSHTAKADLRRRDIHKEQTQEKIEHDAIMKYFELRDDFLNRSRLTPQALRNAYKSSYVGSPQGLFNEFIGTMSSEEQSIVNRYTFIIPVWVLVEDILPFDYKQPVVDIFLRGLVRGYMIQLTLSQSMVATQADIRGSQVFVSKWLNLMLGNAPVKTNVVELYENEDKLRRWLLKQDPIVIPLSCLEIGDSQGHLSIHGANPFYYDQLAMNDEEVNDLLDQARKLIGMEGLNANQNRHVSPSTSNRLTPATTMNNNNNNNSSSNNNNTHSNNNDNNNNHYTNPTNPNSNNNNNTNSNNGMSTESGTITPLGINVHLSTNTNVASARSPTQPNFIDNNNNINTNTTNTPPNGLINTNSNLTTNNTSPSNANINTTTSNAGMVDPTTLLSPPQPNNQQQHQEKNGLLTSTLQNGPIHPNFNPSTNVTALISTITVAQKRKEPYGGLTYPSASHHRPVNSTGGIGNLVNYSNVPQNLPPPPMPNELVEFLEVSLDTQAQLQQQRGDQNKDKNDGNDNISMVDLDDRSVESTSSNNNTSDNISSNSMNNHINNNDTNLNTTPTTTSTGKNISPSHPGGIVLGGGKGQSNINGTHHNHNNMIKKPFIAAPTSTSLLRCNSDNVSTPKHHEQYLVSGGNNNNNNNNNSTLIVQLQSTQLQPQIPTVIPTPSKINPSSRHSVTNSSTNGSTTGSARETNSNSSTRSLNDPLPTLNYILDILSGSSYVMDFAGELILNNTSQQQQSSQQGILGGLVNEPQMGQTSGLLAATPSGSRSTIYPSSSLQMGMSSPQQSLQHLPSNPLNVHGIALVNCRLSNLHEAISQVQSLIFIRRDLGEVNRHYFTPNDHLLANQHPWLTMRPALCLAVDHRAQQQTLRDNQAIKQSGNQLDDINQQYLDKCVLPLISYPTLHLLASPSLKALRETIRKLTSVSNNPTAVPISPFMVHINGRITVLPPELSEMATESTFFACVLTVGVCRASQLDILLDSAAISIPLVHTHVTVSNEDYYSTSHSDNLSTGFQESFCALLSSVSAASGQTKSTVQMSSPTHQHVSFLGHQRHHHPPQSTPQPHFSSSGPFPPSQTSTPRLLGMPASAGQHHTGGYFLHNNNNNNHSQPFPQPQGTPLLGNGSLLNQPHLQTTPSFMTKMLSTPQQHGVGGPSQQSTMMANANHLNSALHFSLGSSIMQPPDQLLQRQLQQPSSVSGGVNGSGGSGSHLSNNNNNNNNINNGNGVMASSHQSHQMTDSIALPGPGPLDMYNSTSGVKVNSIATNNNNISLSQQSQQQGQSPQQQGQSPQQQGQSQQQQPQHLQPPKPFPISSQTIQTTPLQPRLQSLQSLQSLQPVASSSGNSNNVSLPVTPMVSQQISLPPTTINSIVNPTASTVQSQQQGVPQPQSQSQSQQPYTLLQPQQSTISPQTTLPLPQQFQPPSFPSTGTGAPTAPKTMRSQALSSASVFAKKNQNLRK